MCSKKGTITTTPSFESDSREKQKHNLSKLFESLDKHGMVHPIIVSYNGYQVSVGHQRVWYAKQKGYTHIDCYHIPDQEAWEKVFHATANEDYLK